MFTLITLLSLAVAMLIMCPRVEGSFGSESGIPAASSAPAAAPASTPAPAAAPSSPSPAAAPSQAAAPASSGQTQPTASGTAAASQAQAQATLRDQLAQALGSSFNAGQYQDDASALRAVADQIRQAQASQQFAQLGQQIMPQLGAFQNWQKQQEQEAAAKKAAESKWWNPPEYNPDWNNMVEQDANGNLVAKHGYPLDTPQKLNAWRQHQLATLNKLAQDPIATLRPGLEQLIKEVAGGLVQQNVGQITVQQHANDFVRQNTNWLYETDAQNNQVMQNGKPVMSVPGTIFQQHYKKLLDMGTPDGPHMYEMAKRLTYADLLAASQQKPAATAAPVAQPAAPQPHAGANRLQNLDSTAAANGTGIPRKARTPLKQQLSAAMTAAGIESIN